MLKSKTSKRIFEQHPNFRKRYPRGNFWSGYEHHESTGRKDLKASEEYIKNQQRHHQVKVINDRQKKLDVFVAETRKNRKIHQNHFENNFKIYHNSIL